MSAFPVQFSFDCTAEHVPEIDSGESKFVILISGLNPLVYPEEEKISRVKIERKFHKQKHFLAYNL